MSFGSHLDQLSSKHAVLEQAIHEEINRPHPDDVRLIQLKKEKLRIKDEMVRLNGETTH